MQPIRDEVNARYIDKARERTNGNSGRLHRVFDNPEPSVTEHDTLTLWERIKRLFPHSEVLTVGGRTIEKGWVITPGIAAVLLASLLSILAYAYKTSTADSRETRDAIIRMETMLDERTRTFKEEQAKTDAKLENEVKLGSMYREAQAKKDIELKWALRQKGIILEQ
jgi:hypothetical protein